MIFDPASGNLPVALLSPAGMARADQLAIAAGTPGIALMERAGSALADAARQLLQARGRRRAAVLCGPGNNGGDGFVAARMLRAMGFEIAVGLHGRREDLRGDAALAAAGWEGRVGSAALVTLEGVDLVIDGLFGAGLNRDIDGRLRAIIERVDHWRATTGGQVLAVDVPSGIDGASGQIRGVAI